MPHDESLAEPMAPVTPRVLVFFDYACQFCYLDWPRFKQLRAEHGADLVLVPYELRPQMPPEGVPMPPEARHSDRVEDHMRKMARDEGLPLVMPDFVPNTHLAIALGEFTRDLGPEAHEAVHEAIFEAYSGYGADIGSREVLLEIAETHALHPDEVAQVWDAGEYDERIHQFFHLGLAMGVSATPAALICNELFIGTRPYQVLEDSLQRCLVTRDTLGDDDFASGADDEEAAEMSTPSLAAGSEVASTAEGEPASIVR